MPRNLAIREGLATVLLIDCGGALLIWRALALLLALSLTATPALALPTTNLGGVVLENPRIDPSAPALLFDVINQSDKMAVAWGYRVFHARVDQSPVGLGNTVDGFMALIHDDPPVSLDLVPLQQIPSGDGQVVRHRLETSDLHPASALDVSLSFVIFEDGTRFGDDPVADDFLRERRALLTDIRALHRFVEDQASWGRSGAALQTEVKDFVETSCTPLGRLPFQTCHSYASQQIGHWIDDPRRATPEEMDRVLQRTARALDRAANLGAEVEE